MLPAPSPRGKQAILSVANQERFDTVISETRKETGKVWNSRFPRKRKSIATGLPGALESTGIRLIRVVLVKDDAIGRQLIQCRRVDPFVAVTADVAEVQFAGDEDESSHKARF